MITKNFLQTTVFVIFFLLSAVQIANGQSWRICQVCNCFDNERIVDCSFKGLTTENFETFVLPDNCVSVDLSGNDFSDGTLPVSLFQPGANSLKEINLQMSKLSSLPFGIFENLVTLQKLDLSYNRLEDFESGVFGHLQAMVELNLDFNSVTTLKSDILAPFGGFSMVKFSARQNLIANIDENFFALCKKLEILLLTANRFQVVPENLLAPLESVLKTLDLSSNYISFLPQFFFYGMQKLENLDLSNNELKHLSQPSVLEPLRSSLRIFNASYNQLEELSNTTFTSFSSIQKVDFQSNKLTTVEENLWGLVTQNVGAGTNLNTLQELNLAKNQLRHIDEAILASIMPLFTKNPNAKLMLGGNPWQCDSRMAYVKQYGATASALLGQISRGIICQGPRAAVGSTLANFSPEKWEEAPVFDFDFENDIKMQNYRQVFGNCPGNAIGDVSFGNLDECTARCRRERDCIGFTFTPKEGTCLLKSLSCGVPYASNSNRFFEATKISK